MTLHNSTHFSRTLLIALFAALVCFCGSALADPSVKITAPKHKALVSGKIIVIATPSKDATYSYAVLYVDSEGRSLTNVLPIRFLLDTTKLNNGTHFLRVGLNSDFGPIVDSDSVPVIVVNPTTDARYLPKPAAIKQAIASTITPAREGINPAPGSTTPPVAPATAALPKSRITNTPAATAPATTPRATVTPAAPVVAGMPTLKSSKGMPAATPRAIDINTVTKGTPAVAKTAAPATKIWVAEIPAGIETIDTADMTFTIVPARSAGNAPVILLDGKPLASPLQPLTMKDRTFVLLRPLTTIAGGTLDWTNGSATAIVDQHRMTFTIGQNNVMMDGQVVEIDAPVLMRNERMYVPISVWASLYNGLVGYDAEFNCVMLRSHSSLVKAKMAASR
ncbi:MAG: stalk domain-containing protein [Armatimonadota bacterium]